MKNFKLFTSIPKLEKEEEREFNVFFNKSSIFLFRFSIVISIVVMFLYFYLDYLDAPVSYIKMWIFRGLIIFVFLIGFLLSYTKYMIKHFQLISNLVNVFFNSMIVLMIYVSQPNEMAYHNYYAGIMVVWLVSIATRIRLKPFVFNFIFILFFYLIVAIIKQNYLAPENIKYLINNISFMLTTVLAVVIADFLLEIFIKKNFIQSQVLAKQNFEISLRNEEITAQKDEIEKQKLQLEKSHEKIISSVNYAKRIQTAMLPSKEIFDKNFNENFIIYLPKDIVSGDFYWAKKINNKLYYATADCTGHGVPGAFVSMLGMSLLNEIIAKDKDLSAAHVLNEIRILLKKSLKQTTQDSDTRDGMDIAFCILDLETFKLQYSGAYNPLYIVRNNKLTEIKADKQPIAIHLKEKEFTNYIVSLQKNDILYTFSDGYVDQFNEKTNKKLNTSNFKELITKISSKKLTEQKESLINFFNEWKGSMEQIDDVIIIGVKL